MRMLFFRWKRIVSGVIILLCASILSAPIHSVSAITDVQTALYPSSIARGVTFSTPDNRFFIGIPAGALASQEHIDVSIERHVKTAHYEHGKNVVVGPVWEYTLTGAQTVDVQTPLWIRLHPRTLKANYTVAQWNGTIGKWQRIPFTYTNDSAVQFSVNTPNARIALVHSKKRHKRITVEGEASWYVADGAAMNLFPIGTTILVQNPANGKEAITVVKSVGPFVEGRIVDLPKEIFAQLGDLSAGVMHVVIKRQL